jgi:hypothetical protein
MTPSCRSLIALGLLAAAFSPASGFPRRLREAGRSWRELAEVGEMEWRERERADELRRGEDHLRRRVAVKAELMARLLDGRLSLPQTAAAFRRLEGPGQSFALCSRWFPGQSEGERRCRQVIAWVAACLEETHGVDRDKAIRRLEEELDGLLYCQGSVELPAE